MVYFYASNSKKKNIEIVWNSIVYVKKLKTSYLLLFYTLVFCKDFQRKKFTRETLLVAKNLWTAINSFHKNSLDRPIVMWLSNNNTLPIIRPTDKFSRDITISAK